METVHSPNIKLYVLRSLKELTTVVKDLSADIIQIKSDSIIINNDMMSFIKGDIVQEINENVSNKFDILDKRVDHIHQRLGELKNNATHAEELPTNAAAKPSEMSEEVPNNINDTKKKQEAPKETYAKKAMKSNKKHYEERVPAGGKKEGSTVKKKNVTWFRTSISKAPDRKKFENDTNTKLKVVKAYCIKEEGFYPKSNFCAIVPEELRNKTADVANRK